MKRQDAHTGTGASWRSCCVARDNRKINTALRRLKEIIADAVERYRAGRGGTGGILAALTDVRDPETGAHLTPVQVRNEAMVLMSAGSETVAGLLTYACRAMACDSGMAAGLHGEATGVMDGSPLAPQRIGELRYTKRVVTELLRMYPPGALMSRRALVDIDLGGHLIEAGSPVFFCAYLAGCPSARYDLPEMPSCPSVRERTSASAKILPGRNR